MFHYEKENTIYIDKMKKNREAKKAREEKLVLEVKALQVQVSILSFHSAQPTYGASL